MIHNISRFIAALALLATAQGAWAQTPSGNWNDWVNDNNIDWSSAEAKAAAIPQSDDGSTVYISTAEQLAYYAYAVNNDKQTSGSASGYYCGRTVELMADIDLSAHYWKPIGWNRYYYFNGYFHGNGHVITGMHVNGDPQSDNTNNNPGYGLFGYLHTRSGGTSTITDLVLKDFSITASYSGNSFAEFYLGGLVGRCDDNTAITNCLLVNGSVGKSGNNSSAHIGKVAGGGSPSTATANYYHNVSVSGWDGEFEQYAQQTIGGETEARAVALTISSTHGSVALGGTVGRISDGIIYAPANETVTLNTTTDAGYIASLAATGLTLTSGQFTMPDNDDAAITATVSIDPAHFSVNDAGTEYTIKTAEGWNVFCDALQDNDTYNRFSGKTVRLGADITVSRMAGSNGHDFCGTFDGGGNTLDVDISSDDDRDYTAPFSYISNTKANPGDEANSPAAIRNLNVTGTVTATKDWVSGLVGAFWGTLTIEDCTVSASISTNNKHAAGFISREQGNATIRNCRSSVNISGTVSGDGTHAGFIGGSGSGVTTAIEGCLFDGSLLGTATTHCAGFVGYNSGTLTISNSLFDPADVSVGDDNSCTFARYGGTVTVENCYYTAALGTAQGKATRTVAAATDVTIEAVALTGTATQYTVSGITAYSGGGLQRGQTLYYGSDDQLSLTLSNSATPAPQGYQYAYTASAGTLSGTTLTMPDEDVTISVNTAALAPIDWATVNQGDSEDDPYMIYNKDQLLLLAHRVNGTNGETANDYKGKYFKLGADITFTHAANEGDDYAENYEAIGGYLGGYTYRHFRGNFNGDNKTVSGIRIRKTGDGDADSYQGLFGIISGGGTIHDVHLTDARIKSYYYVGGIVGYNNSCTVSGCTVTDSYITATKEPTNNYGTICGSTINTYRLTNNYYHGCTVNGTAVTSGVGCNEADLAANHGALPAYRLDLGANITTPPGTFAGQTGWLDTPPVSPRLAPENGFTLAGNHYFATGYVFTPGSTLASGAAQGYTPRATLGDQLLDPYTPTGDTDPLAGKAIARLTVTADCDGKTLASTEAIYSTRQPVTVAYINADGTPGEASAIALDGTETSLAAGTYFAGLENVNFDHTLNLTGDVTLILKDGCTMNVGTDESRISGHGIRRDGGEQSLTIYSQSLGDDMGALSVYTDNGNNGIVAKAVTINGGHVTIDANGNWATGIYAAVEDITINGGNVSVTAPGTNAWAIYANRNVTINGGTVEASGTADGIRIDNGTIAINGGTVNATGDTTGDSGYGINAGYGSGTITLGWTKPTDRITASSYSGTVTLARLFTDATDPAAPDPADNYYGGTYTDDALNALAGKTLSGTTEVTLTEDNATQALAAINGISGISVTFNRAFTASKPSTICLPFDYTKNEGDGSFYAFTSIEYSGGEYIATMTEPGTTTLTANTPYLYLPSATGNVEFSGTPTTAIAAGTTISGDWTFQGTYDEVKWDTAPTGIYGFSAQNVSDQGISQGEFVKVGAKVRIRPLRAYLKYKNGTENYSAAPTRGTTAELPDRIIVRLIGSDGNTTAIGTLDTRTGEVEIDTWYDLNGRKLSAKPTHRGIYINNGRKVVIK